MANSYIDPSLVRMTLPEGPGWEWNPGATFVTAFNNAQELQNRKRKIELDNEITKLLMPYKMKQAALALDELQSDIKINTAALDLKREEIKYRNAATDRILNGGNTKPRAIFNPTTGRLEPVEGSDSLSNPLEESFSGDERLPALSPLGNVEPPLPGGEDADPNLDVDPNLVPPMRDDEDVPDLSFSRKNPLLGSEFAGDIASGVAPSLPATAEEGFENPLAQIDEDAADAPVGSQYATGVTDVAGGRFESSLKSEEPTSGFDLGNYSQTLSEPASEPQTPEDDKLIQEIQAERQAYEQNIYEMRRQGYEVSPQDLQMGYERIERKSRAQLLPFVTKLGEAGQASMKTMLDGKEPFESAYSIAKRATKAAEPKTGPVTPNNPQLKAALDNKQKYISTLPEDPMMWSPEQKEAVAAFERPIQVLNAVPKKSTLQEVISTRSELESMTSAIKQRRPYAKVNADGSYDFIPFEQIEPMAAESKLKIDALVPRLQQEEDPDLFNPARYKTEKEMLSEKAKYLERNPNAFVITPKGELSYLKNFNAAAEEQKTEDGYSKANPLAVEAESEKRGEQSRSEVMSLDDNIRQAQAKLDYNKFVLRNLESPTRAGSGQIGITQNRAAQWEKTSDNIRTLEGDLQDLLRKKSMVRKHPRRSI